MKLPGQHGAMITPGECLQDQTKKACEEQYRKEIQSV